LHFQFEKKTRVLVGVNAFGVRLRHEILDAWLTEGKKIEEVISQFHKANFDKEFSKKVKLNLP